MTITFKKIGDFYEAYGDAARTVGSALNLTITKARVTGEPMCGIPYHAIYRAAQDLRSMGHTVEGVA